MKSLKTILGIIVIVSFIFVINELPKVFVSVQPSSQLAQVGGGTTYYVATNGNDSSLGSQSSPFRTIQKAADIVNPRDTVIVKDGTYTASGTRLVDLKRGGNSSGWITFKSENKWGAKLDGQNNSTTYGWYPETGVGYIKIQDFDMYGFHEAALMSYATGVNNIEISGNNIHHIGRLCTNEASSHNGIILMNRADSFTIQNNEIHDIGKFGYGENGCTAYAPNTYANYNQDHGVYLHGVSRVSIRNNVFYNNVRGWSIQQASGGGDRDTDITIVNNVFRDHNPLSDLPGQIVMGTSGADRFYVANNIFYDTRTAGVWVYSGTHSGVEIKNNIISNGAAAVGSISGMAISGNLENTDPKFVSPSGLNFHLQQDSPAINAGITVSGFNTDKDGVVRPRGSAWDIGAYEYGSSGGGATTPINGQCGTTLNTCTAGTLNDTADSATAYLWQCLGSNGGTTASCSLPGPTTQYTLTVTKSGTGSGTITSNPAGINNCGTTCNASFNSGASVTLTATPSTGSTFAGWSGCTSVSGTSCTVTMNAARSVTATFNASLGGGVAHYVRAGASGNGTDWANAYGSLPSSLTRGDTYYIADGNYGSYTFDDANSGSTYITIKKATATDHGTDTGWQSGYGDGQAVFAATLRFITDYYIFDGQTRSGWRSGHGFKVSNYPCRDDWGITIGLGFGDPAHYIKIRYTEIEGSRVYDDSCGDEGVQLMWESANTTIEYSWLHEFDETPILARRNDNFLFQYNWVEKNDSSPARHSEAISINEDVDNLIIRYNIFGDMEGTGYIATPGNAFLYDNSNWYIYGNTFYMSGNSGRGGVGNGPIAFFYAGITGDTFIYNNTFVNFNDAAVPGSYTFSGIYIEGTSRFERLYIRNNLWWNSNQVTRPSPNATDFRWESNAFYSTPTNDTDSNRQVATGNPFVNSAGQDYRLLAPTMSGASLPSPFNVDANGNTRGAGGTWDRGAYEYGGSGGGGDVTPVINGQCGTTLNACTAGALSDTADSATQYLWQCVGLNNGSTASCSVQKPSALSGACKNLLSQQPPGTAPALPTLGVSPCSVAKSGGTLTLTFTPQGKYHYMYKKVYISDANWDCQGKTATGNWCPVELTTGNWIRQGGNFNVPLSFLSTLSIGSHYLLSWDWNWNGTCWVGSDGACGTGKWRAQMFEVK